MQHFKKKKTFHYLSEINDLNQNLTCFTFIVQSFYAVLLRKGRLEVSVPGPKETHRITIRPEKGEFHDGKEHSVRIERSRK